MSADGADRAAGSGLSGVVSPALDDVARVITEATSGLPDDDRDRADDITAIRRVIDRRIRLAADQARRGAVAPVARTLQRLSGHLGVFADEADLSWGPFGTSPGDAIRQNAESLRRLAVELSPQSGSAAVRTVMAGRLDALTVFWNAGRRQVRTASDLGLRIRSLRQGVALGADRYTTAAELRSIAALLLRDLTAAGADSDGVPAFVRSRAVLLRRSADWFAHPVNADADLGMLPA